MTVKKTTPYQTAIVTCDSNTDCIRDVRHGYYSHEHRLQAHRVTTAVHSATPYSVASPHITAKMELRPFSGINRTGPI
jgi:hypothetical protein